MIRLEFRFKCRTCDRDTEKAFHAPDQARNGFFQRFMEELIRDGALDCAECDAELRRLAPGTYRTGDRCPWPATILTSQDSEGRR